MSSWRWKDVVQSIVLYGAATISCVYLATQVLARFDPEADAKSEAHNKALAATARLTSILQARSQADNDDQDDGKELGQDRSSIRKLRIGAEQLHLTSYEQTIATDVVAPTEIPVTFQDVGGLDSIVEELREAIIYPLTMPHIYSTNSSLLSAPSGVLLHGPPGCGKTMLAKALARESGACFINLHISTLTEKWYGDSNKLVNAVFTLARKLQPAIVFIDEIDAVLGQRHSGEHEASSMVKAEFMTLWDGLTSANSSGEQQRICILGATNRPQDIDEAILRRLPKKFAISLPTSNQRRAIFKLTLKNTKIDASSFDPDLLVKLSAGMSGSDIKEACRDAAMVPVREFLADAKDNKKQIKGIDPRDMRGLQTDDFFGRRGASVENFRARPGQVRDEKSGHTSPSSTGDSFHEVEDVS